MLEPHWLSSAGDIVILVSPCWDPQGLWVAQAFGTTGHHEVLLIQTPHPARHQAGDSEGKGSREGSDCQGGKHVGLGKWGQVLGSPGWWHC